MTLLCTRQRACVFSIQKENNNNTILLPADGATSVLSVATAATVVPARVILGSDI